MSYDDVQTLTHHYFLFFGMHNGCLYYSQYHTIVPSVLSFETEVSIVFSLHTTHGSLCVLRAMLCVSQVS
jgi:hypothetical protein